MADIVGMDIDGGVLQSQSKVTYYDTNIIGLHQRRFKQPADFEHLELTKHGSRHACQGSPTVHTLGFSFCMFAKLSYSD